MPKKRKDGLTDTQINILEHLKMIGPSTILELSNEVGRSKEAVRDAMIELHKFKRVYVKDWPYIGIQRARLWALKTGSSQVDAFKPPRVTDQDYQRNYRERHKARLAIRRSVRAAVGNPFAALMIGG